MPLFEFLTFFSALNSFLTSSLLIFAQTISDAMLHDLQLKNERELSIHELACLRYERRKYFYLRRIHHIMSDMTA